MSKPQVFTLEPCGTEPASLSRDASLLHLSSSCCSNTFEFACTESGKEFCIWTSGLCSMVMQGLSTSHPTCLTAGCGLRLAHVSWWPHSRAVRWETNGSQLISTN